MFRIAYLHIPTFQIVVHQKHEQIRGQPFALVTGKLTQGGYNRARIFMCSKEAVQKGIVPGMRLFEAQALCSNLLLRECDQELYTSAQRKLVNTLISCSPKVTAQEVGDFLLDASGLLRIGGENKFCHNVLKACSQAGFTDAYLGIADSTFAAMVAAQLKERRFYIVSKNYDAQFLAPFSIRHLRLAHEIEETLWDLGIKSMGQLAKLPEEEITKRFGKSGKLAHEWARGYDIRQPYLPEAEIKFECSVDMGGAVSSLNESMFAFKAMLDRLTAELKQSGLWAEELVLSLYNEDDKFDERTLKLIRASNHAKFLLEVVKLSLEANPLSREFTKAKLSLSRFSAEIYKQTKILDPKTLRLNKTDPKGGRVQRAPTEVQEQLHFVIEAQEPGHAWRAPTIGQALSVGRGGASPPRSEVAGPSGQAPSAGRSGDAPPGSEASVSAGACNAPLQNISDPSESNSSIQNISDPDEDNPMVLLQRFMTRIGENATVKAVASDQYTFNYAGVWTPVTQNSFVDSIIPINLTYINENANEQLVSDLVLRKNNKPLPVLVELKKSIPLAINYNKQWHRVKHITTPEYLSILWWNQGSSKSYYKVLVEPMERKYQSKSTETKESNENHNASLILLAYDRCKNGWYIEGFFD
jgi:nucleotidyltransferase/DNA polymerase involved in DNA repair